MRKLWDRQEYDSGICDDLYLTLEPAGEVILGIYLLKFPAATLKLTLTTSIAKISWIQLFAPIYSDM